MINEIAEKISNLRKQKGLTLKQLSEMTGLSISFLSQVENGYSSLAITSLKKIADALNVPITEFSALPVTKASILSKANKKYSK